MHHTHTQPVSHEEHEALKLKSANLADGQTSAAIAKAFAKSKVTKATRQ